MENVHSNIQSTTNTTTTTSSTSKKHTNATTMNTMITNTTPTKNTSTVPTKRIMGEKQFTPTKRQKIEKLASLFNPTPFDSVEMPTETEVELTSLLHEFPRQTFPNSPPLLLLSQLHAASKDRTNVDRELEQLKKNGTIRVFRLITGKTDYFVVITSDYMAKIQHLKEKDKGHEEIYDRFVNKVLKSHTDVYITKEVLLGLMFDSEPSNDYAITVLVNSELLLNRADVDSFWFRVPFTGGVVKSLVKGRKEIVSMLKRQKFKELLLSDMKTKRLRYSNLPIDFLVKDMIGLGALESVVTTSGPLIRLLQEI